MAGNQANVSTRLSRWCFTLNNYTDDEVNSIVERCEPASRYLVFGYEVGATGTPHLQGFVVFNTSTRFNTVKNLISPRVHLVRARGTNVQASEYCKKGGNYEEFGDLPPDQGKRTDWEEYIEWVVDLGVMPSKWQIMRFNPTLWARYSVRCLEIAEAHLPSVDITGEEAPRLGWQQTMAGKIENIGAGNPARKRIVYFVVDPVGNAGKSWFCSWALSKYPDLTQVLSIGKRDDIAYAIDVTKTIFLFDVPRTQMQFFQYSLLEMLKDQRVQSNKYVSCVKTLRTVPFVAVFSNEGPDMNAMSMDRYRVFNV